MPISQARQAWRNAKKTYKAQLTAIKFDQDFGPELDKLEKLKNSTGKNMGQMMSLDTQTKEAAKKCAQTANTYMQKVNAVTDPAAKTALHNALAQIKTECEKFM